jgi:hypothetical protein
VRRVVPAFVGVLIPIFLLVLDWNWRRRRKALRNRGPTPWFPESFLIFALHVTGLA